MKEHLVVQPALPLERYTAQAGYRRYDQAKRALDIAVSATLLLLLSPLMFIIAVAIAMDSRGPVFYRQQRVGRNRRRRQEPLRLFGNVIRLDLRRRDERGQIFSMIKFRTMAVDAEQATGPVWAKEDDPRVTRVGRFLRRTRLDELPQLWNVLVGEMTLVGPRPERPEFVRQFAVQIPGYTDRHWVTPGITGLSQVRQGYDTCLNDVRNKLRHDCEYIRERSLLLDLYICWRTFAVVFNGGGAR